jgi:hypothetical protein
MIYIHVINRELQFAASAMLFDDHPVFIKHQKELLKEIAAARSDAGEFGLRACLRGQHEPAAGSERGLTTSSD